MNAKASTYDGSTLLSQDEISENLRAFGDNEVCLREAVLMLPVEKDTGKAPAFFGLPRPCP